MGESENIISDLEKTIKEFIKIRQKPLLILYWSNSDGEIADLDVNLLEDLFNRYCNERGVEKIKNLDVIIYTRGGAVNASYLVAQMIRGYSHNIEIFIPKHAYSGGTMISLCSDKILMGLNSKISPIDVQLGGKMAIMDIEKYIEFIAHSCNALSLEDETARSSVLIELLKELIKRINPLKLGDLFRLRSLAEYYARILLLDYMFKSDPNRWIKVKDIIKKLTSESPTHSLDMDINIVRGIGLKVELINGKLYKLGQSILDYCFDLEKEGLICKYPSRDCKVRMPFFEIFDENEVQK